MNESITKIIDRISETLNFFDFSFIVSGIATFSISFFTINYFYDIDLSKINKSILIIGLIVIIYILGLLSFAAGKCIRLFILNHSKDKFINIIRKGLSYTGLDKSYKDLMNDNEEIKENLELFYTQVWIELRHCKEAESTIKYLNRFWVMQAVLEGLFFSFIIGYFLGIILSFSKLSFIIISIISLLGFLICYYEAKRYAETQIYEVLITYKKLIFHEKQQ